MLINFFADAVAKKKEYIAQVLTHGISKIIDYLGKPEFQEAFKTSDGQFAIEQEDCLVRFTECLSNYITNVTALREISLRKGREVILSINDLLEVA